MPGDSPAAPAGRASRSRERFRPRRAAWFQWAAASVLALAPLLYWWLVGPDSYSYGYFTYGRPERCVGHEFMLHHGYGILEAVYTVLLFWFGGLPLMLVAFAAWLAGNRLGRPRIGRIVTRAVTTVIGLVTFLPLLPTVLDAVLDVSCMQMWGGSFILSTTLGQALITFVYLVLMLRAVRPSHVRRSAVARAALSLLVILPLVFLPVSDTVSGKVSDFEDCFSAGLGFPEDVEAEGGNLERRFVCLARSGPWGQGGVPEFAGMPDDQVLAYGRHLCAAVVRAGGNARNRAPYESLGLTYSMELAESLKLICPQVVAVEKAEAERERLAEERKQAALEAKCAAYPPHRPSIRPVRRAAGAVHTDYNALVALEDEDFEMIEASPLLVKGLVGAEPGIVQVTVANEFATVCVTAEAYDRRPPLERRGWDTVREIPYRSTRGNLAFVDFYGGRRLVNLTVAGKGGYRVRVHVRGSEEAWKNGEDAVEQFLIMVYPDKPL
ncbi:hypothetical protein [Planobispora rosea]|uniref:hypothetical protein n=1 Tax=Planobispora rosea TaxID=35762 RepID=UPI00083AE4A2|nr:hypothetical protein [Planobispora rosea]